MKRRPQLTALIPLALLAAGCAAGPAAVPFTDADRAALADITHQALAIANGETPDWQAYADLYYAEDAWVQMEGAPTVMGRPAIVELLQGFTGVSSLEFDQIRIDGAGDMAYVVGTATMQLPGEGGQLIEEGYRYLEVWKRQSDGSWKVVQDISNRSAPAAE